MLVPDAVNALAIPALGRFDLQAHLLADRAGEEPAHAVGLPTGGEDPQKRASWWGISGKPLSGEV